MLIAYCLVQGIDPKNFYLFHECSPELDLLVDMRKMNNKKAADLVSLKSMVVHPTSLWSKGHMMHAFYQKKCVLSVVIPLTNSSSSGSSMADHTKRVLERVQMANLTDNIEYEEELPSEAAPSSAAPEKPKKKAKTASAASE